MPVGRHPCLVLPRYSSRCEFSSASRARPRWSHRGPYLEASALSYGNDCPAPIHLPVFRARRSARRCNCRCTAHFNGSVVVLWHRNAALQGHQAIPEQTLLGQTYASSFGQASLGPLLRVRVQPLTQRRLENVDAPPAVDRIVARFGNAVGARGHAVARLLVALGLRHGRCPRGVR